jgi:hypothetical protein
MENTMEHTLNDESTRVALSASRGYLLVADDGPVGRVELPLERPEQPGADYVVVRARGRFVGRHPVVSSQIVRRVDRARRLVFVRGTSRQIRRLPERLPLSI